MHNAFLLLAIAVPLCAADPLTGVWKVNLEKSVLEGASSIASNLTAAYTLDSSGNLQVTMTAFPINQTIQVENFERYAQCDGIERPLRHNPFPENVWGESIQSGDIAFAASCKRLNSGTRALDVVARQGGKLVASSRRIISDSGGLISETKTGVNRRGEYYRALLIWERK